MLRWQWKNENQNKHNDRADWVLFIVVSSVVHMVMCITLFWSGHSHGQRLLVTLQKKKGYSTITLREYSAPPIKKTTKPVVVSSAKKAPTQTDAPKAPQKQIEKTMIAKEDSKAVVKELAAKSIPKPVKAKAAVPPVVKKNELKKEAVKKTVVEKKLIKKEVVQEGVDQKQPTEERNEPITIAAQQDDQRFMQLYNAIACFWAPPVGIASDSICEITITVGYDCVLKTVEITKKSGILMYDLAARKAVMQTKFPLWAAGKTITVRFEQ